MRQTIHQVELEYCYLQINLFLPLVENWGGSGLTEYPVAYISGSTSLAIILVLLLVYKLCCAKLCAEHFFSARLWTVWIYKVVWYLTCHPLLGIRPQLSLHGRSVFLGHIETRLETYALAQLYLIFKSFKHLEVFKDFLCRKAYFQIEGL